VIVTGHGQDTAPGRGARHVGVLEDVGATVHAGAFAVPDAKDAVEFIAARRRETQLLRAPQGGGSQLFVDARLEHNVLRLQVLARFPKGLIVVAQRGATVAADEASGVFTASASRWRCSMGSFTKACTPLMKARPWSREYLSSSVTVSSALRMCSGKGAFIRVSSVKPV
jgi:hypothetical protein